MYEYDNSRNNKGIQKAMGKMYEDKRSLFESKDIGLITYKEEGCSEKAFASWARSYGYDKEEKSLAQIFDEKLARIYEKKKSRFMRKQGIDTTVLWSRELEDAEIEFANKNSWLRKLMEKRLYRNLNDLVKYNTCYPDKYAKMMLTDPDKALRESTKKISKILEEISKKDRTYALGRNVCFNGENVHVNMNTKYKYSLPHELGHALNARSKSLSKLIHKMYNPVLNIPMTKFSVSLLVIPILTALFRRKKVEGEESQTGIGKALDFTKEHCVGITAALSAPKLIEEASASIRGVNMMKGYLRKNEMKMLKGFLGRAYGTYLTGVGIIISIVWGADKVKNLIDKPKKVEIQTKNDIEA